MRVHSRDVCTHVTNPSKEVHTKEQKRHIVTPEGEIQVLTLHANNLLTFSHFSPTPN